MTFLDLGSDSPPIHPWLFKVTFLDCKAEIEEAPLAWGLERRRGGNAVCKATDMERKAVLLGMNKEVYQPQLSNQNIFKVN